jgi:hypothetical protein
MFRRRRDGALGETVSAFAAFRAALASVEEAKAALASAAPTGRRAGRPLAEAIMGFESGLRQAREQMPGWREPSVFGEWGECLSALEEAGRRAERLRLGATPDGYEKLYGALGELLEPLEAFAKARGRFRQLGV